MNEQEKINELKELRKNLSFWKEQKYFDTQARQDAMMNGQRHEEENTRKIDAEIQEAKDGIALYELWDAGIVEKLDKQTQDADDAMAKSNVASAMNQ